MSRTDQRPLTLDPGEAADVELAEAARARGRASPSLGDEGLDVLGGGRRDVRLAPVPGIGEHTVEAAAGVPVDGGDEGERVWCVVGLIGDAIGNDDLVAALDRGLGVVGLDGSLVPVDHDAGVGVREVALGLRRWPRGRFSGSSSPPRAGPC